MNFICNGGIVFVFLLDPVDISHFCRVEFNSAEIRHLSQLTHFRPTSTGLVALSDRNATPISNVEFLPSCVNLVGLKKKKKLGHSGINAIWQESTVVQWSRG